METCSGEPQALLFAQHFATLPEPRRRPPPHPLLSILFLVLAAHLGGAEGWDAMVALARAKGAGLQSFLDLPQGVPSADPLRRVFAALEPQAVTACFGSWVGALAGALHGEGVAVAGKAVRGAYAAARRTTPLYLLHVWARPQRLLGHVLRFLEKGGSRREALLG